MAYTVETEIANEALLMVSDKMINNLSDNTPRAEILRHLFQQTADEVARAYPWNFAISRKTLDQDVETPVNGFSYQYSLPSDCLKALVINNDPEYTFKIEGRKLVTDQDTVILKFLRRETNYGIWDPLAKAALAARLASKIAYPLSKSKTLMQSMFAVYIQVLEEAQEIDAQEGTADDLISDELLDARGGAGGFYRANR